MINYLNLYSVFLFSVYKYINNSYLTNHCSIQTYIVQCGIVVNFSITHGMTNTVIPIKILRQLCIKFIIIINTYLNHIDKE